MFLKTLQGHYRRVDDAAFIGAINDNGTWKIFAGASATATDPDKIAAYANETDARAALDELAALLGTSPAPGNPT